MNKKNVKRYIDKINLLYDNVLTDDDLSEMEKNLLLSYTKSLYEAIIEGDEELYDPIDEVVEVDEDEIEEHEEDEVIEVEEEDEDYSEEDDEERQRKQKTQRISITFLNDLCLVVSSWNQQVAEPIYANKLNSTAKLEKISLSF